MTITFEFIHVQVVFFFFNYETPQRLFAKIHMKKKSITLWHKYRFVLCINVLRILVSCACELVAFN